MKNELVEFWRECDLAAPPFAHPRDLPVLCLRSNRYVDVETKDLDAFVNSPRFGDFSDNRMHLSLFPQPYAGDLGRADIVVLLLNPGFYFTDYYAETRVSGFRSVLEKNLRQSLHGTAFPFFWLNPDLCWHSGFVWWERKVRDIATLIAIAKFGGSYLKALRDLSRRVAQLELVAYHSSSSPGHPLIKRLPSAHVICRYAREVLVPAAKAGSKTIIVLRQAAAWDLPDQSTGSENIVVYKGGLTRGASLGPRTSGGQAILRRYGIA